MENSVNEKILNPIAIRLCGGEFNLVVGFLLIKQFSFNHNLLPKTIYMPEN